jgi:Fe-S oxidoreductase
MVEEARAEVRRTLEALRPHLEAGTPIVGLEPSCLLGFRDEVQALFPGDPLARQASRVALLDEWLAARLGEGLVPPWKSAPQHSGTPALQRASLRSWPNF